VDNHAGHLLIIEACGAHPSRIIGMASVNPWYNDAPAELEWALDNGLHGLMLDPVHQGFCLSDDIVDPLVRPAVDRGAVIYAHTGTAGIAEPLQLAELARRYPPGRFIMGHAGASDYYSDALRAVEMYDNIWLETSRNGPANYGLFRSRNVLGKVIFGSSCPEYIPKTEIEILGDILDHDECRAVLETNIRAVLPGVLP
jgi:predicted TIM-barrel fold metal-dependent hydrolase